MLKNGKLFGKDYFAVTGKTAAELVYERVNAEKPAMGLTTWKDAPDGKILKRDISVAKNYLNEKELSRLNRLVTMFIDYAELMAEDEVLMSMQDWVEQTRYVLFGKMKGVEYFMKLPDQLKDIVYRLLQEPTLDNFRNFLKGQTGEHNSIDFKEKWIEPTKLVKEMLAIANSGGGIIIFGVKEKEDKSFSYDGIEEIVDKAKISNDIKNYISTELKYEVYDFVYDTSEYEKLQNHKYQMMVIKDCPRFIPFMSMKESTNLKKNRIYIRRGTSCEEATSEEITDIIKRRMNAEYPDSGKTLNLDEHLEQLKTLYSKISPTNEYYQGGIGNSLLKLTEVIKAVSAGEWISEDNPLYPEEDYEEFIARMIDEKKWKIERELDLI